MHLVSASANIIDMCASGVHLLATNVGRCKTILIGCTLLQFLREDEVAGQRTGNRAGNLIPAP